MSDKFHGHRRSPEDMGGRFVEAWHRAQRGNELIEPILVEASSADAAALAALHAKALPPGWPAEDFAASCRNANRLVLKADGAQVLGLAVLQFAADEAEILSIAVAEEARQRGIGSSILKALIAACRQKLVSYIYLEAAESNAAALNLYRKFGFAAIASRKNYYEAKGPAPVTALIMRLELGRGFSSID